MVKKNSTESKALMVLVTVLAIQISLGIATILTERLPYIASFLVVSGAALLGCCSLFIMITQSNKLKDFNF